MAIIIYTEDNEYDPRMKEPYLTFNRKFEEQISEIDGAVIKLPVSRRRGIPDGLGDDVFYFSDAVLRFMYKKLPDDGNLFLIHHVIEYDFDASFEEFQRDMAEAMMRRTEYIYIPCVKHLEFSYRLKSRHAVQLTFDVVTRDNSLQEVSNLMISNDIILFARGW